ncbi:hypothetical protein HDA32_005574 [Spinactinospora alkalitolerans]|uniref:Core-binding (CB) domain-containing protein n=1 Tax=Spinactinospora alkalitolerans TaxID=687207 RepID=A0A852U8N3_9ACTN|nr:hypothetical protein [Spinactinospora alkalitolerans]NYE50454.1 hypothetical protein [Spinactinospora alkalitolerans]
MELGVLPRTDKQLLHFEAWLHCRLTELDGSPHLPLLRQLGTGHQLPTLRRRATRRPLTPSARRFASEELTRASEFPTWLNARNTDLDQLAQTDIDEWHTTHLSREIRSLRAFLNWAMATGRAPRLHLPAQQTRRGQVLTQRRRLELVRKVLNSGYPARLQMAACLMLLYAQPDRPPHPRRHHRGIAGEVITRLGEPPTPVPEPFDELFLQAKEERAGLAMGANPDSRWVFPSRRAGQPITQQTLANHIHDLGIPAQAARTAAL